MRCAASTPSWGQKTSSAATADGLEVLHEGRPRKGPSSLASGALPCRCAVRQSTRFRGARYEEKPRSPEPLVGDRSGLTSEEGWSTSRRLRPSCACARPRPIEPQHLAPPPRVVCLCGRRAGSGGGCSSRSPRLPRSRSSRARAARLSSPAHRARSARATPNTTSLATCSRRATRASRSTTCRRPSP